MAMFKRCLLSFLILFVLPVTVHGATYRIGSNGSDIVELQGMLSKLGYGNRTIDGVFGKSTEAGLKSFQSDYGLHPDGVYGPNTQKELVKAVSTPFGETYVIAEGDSLWTLSRKFKSTISSITKANGISEDSTLKIGQKLLIPRDRLDPASRGMMRTDSTHAKMVPWETADSIIRVGGPFTVTDVRTGISFKAKRIGGDLHADSEPLTGNDTDAFKRIYGGSWSWDRHAVVIRYGTMRLAASINGMPHGADSISGNDFNGMFCIHFLGSKVHQSRTVDPEHQAMIEYASNF